MANFRNFYRSLILTSMLVVVLSITGEKADRAASSNSTTKAPVPKTQAPPVTTVPAGSTTKAPVPTTQAPPVTTQAPAGTTPSTSAILNQLVAQVAGIFIQTN